MKNSPAVYSAWIKTGTGCQYEGQDFQIPATDGSRDTPQTPAGHLALRQLWLLQVQADVQHIFFKQHGALWARI